VAAGTHPRRCLAGGLQVQAGGGRLQALACLTRASVHHLTAGAPCSLHARGRLHLVRAVGGGGGDSCSPAPPEGSARP